MSWEDRCSWHGTFWQEVDNAGNTLSTYGYVLKRKKEFAEFHHAVTYLLEHDYCARSTPHMKAVNWGPML